MSQSIKLDSTIKKSGVSFPIDETTLKVLLVVNSRQDSLLKVSDELIKENNILNSLNESMIITLKEQVANRNNNLIISQSLNSSLKYQVGSLEKTNKNLNFRVKLFKITTIVVPITVGGLIYYTTRCRH